MEAVDHHFRHARGRIVAALTKVFGLQNIDLAEDVTQDAFRKALEVWSIRGTPPDPAAWLMVTARNGALDVIRRESRLRTCDPEWDPMLQGEWTAESHLDRILGPAAIKDDELRLMFSCCHHGLSEEVQVALILNLLSGFSVKEVASAYVSSGHAIEKRISRGKRVLAESRTLFNVSRKQEFEERLPAVQRALYLLFNEGYHSASSEAAIRAQLCAEAIRLTELLIEHPFGGTPSTYALASLMCFNAARLRSRTDEQGELHSLIEQNRSLWDPGFIAAGAAHMSKSAFGPVISEYHIEAMLASAHVQAPDLESTDWSRIVGLYDHLLKLKPSPIIELNRAIAIGQRDGPKHGLVALRVIGDQQKLNQYPFFWVAQADFELKVGLREEARNSFLSALETARNPQERQFISARLKSLE